MFTALLSKNLLKKFTHQAWQTQIFEIKNNFYLNTCINSPNNIEGTMQKKSDDMKKVYKELGDCFKEDINNINDGYPILLWQWI